MWLGASSTEGLSHRGAPPTTSPAADMAHSSGSIPGGERCPACEPQGAGLTAGTALGILSLLQALLAAELTAGTELLVEGGSQWVAVGRMLLPLQAP